MKSFTGFGRLAIALCAFFFGSEAVMVQIAYENGFNSITLSACRFIIAALILLAVMLIRGVPLLPPVKLRSQVLIHGVLQSILTISIYVSLTFLPSAIAVLFFYAYPSITAILAKLLFRQSLGWPRLAALTLSALGLLLLYYNSAVELDLRGIVCSLIGALCNGLRLSLSQRIIDKMNIFTYNLNLLTVVTVLSLATALTGWLGPFDISSVRLGAVFPLLYIAIIVTTLTFALFNKFLPQVGAVDASLLMLLEPVSTAVLSFMIFNDRFAGWQWLGGLLVIFAVALPILTQKQIPVVTAKEE